MSIEAPRPIARYTRKVPQPAVRKDARPRFFAGPRAPMRAAKKYDARLWRKKQRQEKQKRKPARGMRLQGEQNPPMTFLRLLYGDL